MSKLANNLYNLSMLAMKDHYVDAVPLPGTIDYTTCTPGELEHMGRLVLERFGRDPRRWIGQGVDDIPSLVELLESMPQQTAPQSLVTLEESDANDDGLVVLFPGQYGLSRSFQRLAGLVPGANTVVGLDYDGLDESRPVARSMEECIALFRDELLGRRGAQLERMARSGRQLVMFGFCIGACYAHAMADCLKRELDLDIRLVYFDGHPAQWLSGTRMSAIFRQSKRALEIVRVKGDIERRLVRQGCRQMRLVGRHSAGMVDVDALLLRSSAISRSWELSSEAWEPYVRTCTQIDFNDLSHLDLIQLRQEGRIAQYLEPGYRFAA